MFSNKSIYHFLKSAAEEYPNLLTSPSELFEFISKVSLKYQSNTLWQWLHTRNGMWFEIDINLNSREYTGHQILYLSQRWKFCCFIRWSCLDKISGFFCYYYYYFTYLPTTSTRTLNCRYHWATILEKLWFFFLFVFLFVFFFSQKAKINIS